MKLKLLYAITLWFTLITTDGHPTGHPDIASLEESNVTPYSFGFQDPVPLTTNPIFIEDPIGIYDEVKHKSLDIPEEVKPYPAGEQDELIEFAPAPNITSNSTIEGDPGVAQILLDVATIRPTIVDYYTEAVDNVTLNDLYDYLDGN